MIPDWVLPLSGLLLAVAFLLGAWPTGPAPRGYVSVILAVLAICGFGAVTLIALTNGA